MVESVYKNDLRANFEPGSNLPKISSRLDPVRAYEWEVRFYGLPVEYAGENVNLTMAAKQVSPIGGTIDDIVVDRINDKLFYPGKFTPDEVTITFDNLLLERTTPALMNWFQSIYDPLTGDSRKFSAPGGPGNRSFKALKMTVIELDNTRNPHAFIELYGVYPKSIKFSEKNYGTNEGSTVEVTFRWEFFSYGKYADQNQ